MAKVNNTEKCCENCGNLCPIGEGDYICDENPTLMVLSEYLPTDEYLWCEGHYWKGMK